jgi:alpha-glucosidase
MSTKIPIAFLVASALGACSGGFSPEAGPDATADATPDADTATNARDASLSDTGVDGSSAPDAAPPRRWSSPPLYWTAYEYNYVHDDYIPESVWQANVDWVAATLAPHGYDAVVTDGWVYGDSTVNGDGYITKYNNSWAHDFAYWQAYCASKGLRLGVYYNPLWIQRSAYVQNNAVAHTGYTIQSIAGALRATNKYGKYWLDPAKPGAKEYVQGYVAYFKSIGVKLLRLDFLTEFETTYGTPAYDQALTWIREAAGDDLFLSLVMPNGRNMAATEIKYGDMMRVSEDTFTGGFNALSDRGRGVLNAAWPVAENAFDGFTHFSPVSGRGQMILDGDAIRLNTFANDVERRTCLSLYTIAGSPIPIADQVDTIGSSGALLQNEELLALSRSWLVGKPLSPTRSGVDSQRWAGQTEDGDWVVGLFNREATAQARSVDYASDLGLAAAAPTRDLWAHADLGSANAHTANLLPHDSALVKIRTVQKKYEAEVAALSGGAKFNSDHGGHSAFGFVDGLNQPAARVRFHVARAAAGALKMRVRYANGATIAKTGSVYVNGAKSGTLTMGALSTWEAWSDVVVDIALSQGLNVVDVAVDAGDTGGFNLDYVQVE